MVRRVLLIFVLVLLFPAAIAGFAALAAERPASSSGSLVLPAGDPVAGRAVFLRMQCNTCHMITGKNSEGVALPVTSTPAPLLNSEVAKKDQGSLVTSVLNPSHVIESKAAGERVGTLSPMGSFAHALTVRQLVDLVAFLQSIEETEIKKAK